MAERVGFEPTARLPVRVISSHADSATLAPLHQLARSIGNGFSSRFNGSRTKPRASWVYAISSLLFPLSVAVITDRRQEAGNRRQEYRFSPASCFLSPSNSEK